jgi:hypothetical protein
MKTTTMICPGRGTSPPRSKKLTTYQSRKTWQQEASCTAGHRRTTKRPMVAPATAVMVAETTAATTTAAMTTAAMTTATAAQPL